MGLHGSHDDDDELIRCGWDHWTPCPSSGYLLLVHTSWWRELQMAHTLCNLNIGGGSSNKSICKRNLWCDLTQHAVYTSAKIHFLDTGLWQSRGCVKEAPKAASQTSCACSHLDSHSPGPGDYSIFLQIWISLAPRKMHIQPAVALTG